jgi:fimbrial chaperone protein
MTKIKLFGLVALVLAVCAGFTIPSFANVMISPIYIIFSDRDRSAEVTLFNTSDSINVYRLAWTYKRQKEDGSYENLSGPMDPAHDPAKFMRFSPRQVTLAPNGKQKIRIQLQKPADLPDGEYRMHLELQRLPNMESISNGQTAEGVQMQLRVFLGVAMPVVVRQGEYDAKTAIVDARFVTRKKEDGGSGGPELMVKVTRTGKHGTYGRLRVFWQHDGEEEQVGTLNNFSIYAENPQRIGYVQLSRDSIPSGSLRIVYEGDGPQRGKIYSEQTIRVGR